MGTKNESPHAAGVMLDQRKLVVHDMGAHLACTYEDAAGEIIAETPKHASPRTRSRFQWLVSQARAARGLNLSEEQALARLERAESRERQRREEFERLQVQLEALAKICEALRR